MLKNIILVILEIVLITGVSVYAQGGGGRQPPTATPQVYHNYLAFVQRQPTATITPTPLPPLPTPTPTSTPAPVRINQIVLTLDDVGEGYFVYDEYWFIPHDLEGAELGIFRAFEHENKYVKALLVHNEVILFDNAAAAQEGVDALAGRLLAREDIEAELASHETVGDYSKVFYVRHNSAGIFYIISSKGDVLVHVSTAAYHWVADLDYSVSFAETCVSKVGDGLDKAPERALPIYIQPDYMHDIVTDWDEVTKGE